MLHSVNITNKQGVVSLAPSLAKATEDELIENLVASLLWFPETQAQIHTTEHQFKYIDKFTIVVNGEKNELLEIKMDDILGKIRNKIPKI